MALALVRQFDGRVETFLREDGPAGWTPPEEYVLIPEAELPEGWQRVDPEATEPEWIGFQRALMGAASVNALLAACLSPQAAPLGGATIYGGLVVGLGQVATGGAPATFLEAWRGGMMAGLISPEVAGEVIRLAEPFNLPGEFLEGLKP